MTALGKTGMDAMCALWRRWCWCWRWEEEEAEGEERGLLLGAHAEAAAAPVDAAGPAAAVACCCAPTLAAASSSSSASAAEAAAAALMPSAMSVPSAVCTRPCARNARSSEGSLCVCGKARKSGMGVMQCVVWFA